MTEPYEQDENIIVSKLHFKFIRNFLKIFILLIGSLCGVLLLFSFLITVDDTVESSGIVLPKSEFIIKSKVNGIVSNIYVDDGSYVKKNDTMVVFNNTADVVELQRIERDLFIKEKLAQKAKFDLILSNGELQTKEKLASLDLSNKKLELQEDTLLKKIDGLISNGIVPFETQVKQLSVKKAELFLGQINEQKMRNELNKYDLGILENEIEKLIASKKLLEENIKKSIVLAPTEGVVFLSDKRKILGSFFSEGQILFELVDINKGWMLKLMTSDKDIPFVKEDQKVKVYFNSFPYMKYKIFSGCVKKVISSPESQEFKYTVYVDSLDINSLKKRSTFFHLKKGMIADCKIFKESKILIEYAIDKFLDKSSI